MLQQTNQTENVILSKLIREIPRDIKGTVEILLESIYRAKETN